MNKMNLLEEKKYQ